LPNPPRAFRDLLKLEPLTLVTSSCDFFQCLCFCLRTCVTSVLVHNVGTPSNQPEWVDHMRDSLQPTDWPLLYSQGQLGHAHPSGSTYPFPLGPSYFSCPPSCLA
jgi:hypothetical protein